VLSLNDFIAYGQSKLANILHAKELSRILKVLPFFAEEKRMNWGGTKEIYFVNRRRE
jgi:hypothetical protein